MGLHLPDLFHWSPKENREEIRKHGLRTYSPSTTHSPDEDGTRLAYPYICLSPEPSRAWSLSGDFQDETEIMFWDLWEVRLAEKDNVRVRADFGPEIQEVKVFSPIPADRVWYVATREATYAVPADG